MTVRRLVEGVRVIDDRVDRDRVIVDGADRRVVFGDAGVDAVVDLLSVPAAQQPALFDALEALPGGDRAVELIGGAGLIEHCDGGDRCNAPRPIPLDLERFVSRSLPVASVFRCRHDALDRLRATTVWSFGALHLVPDLPELLAANGLTDVGADGTNGASRPAGAGIIGLGVADLDAGEVCPAPPEGFPPGADWLRVGVGLDAGLIEIGPLWEPGLHQCRSCFVRGWRPPEPPEPEPVARSSPGSVPAGAVRELAAAWAATELLALRVLVPRPIVLSTTGWRRLQIATASEEEPVVPQEAACPDCGGGNLGCDVTGEHTPARFEERYRRVSFQEPSPRDIERQTDWEIEARQRVEDRRSDLRAFDGGPVHDDPRPWHRSAGDDPVDPEDLRRVARSALDRLELACTVAVGVMARPASEGSGVLRRGAPSGGDVREYLVAGTIPTLGPGPGTEDGLLFWFDDAACRLRRLRFADRPRPDAARAAGSGRTGPRPGVADHGAVTLAVVTDPALLVHKYALHGLRVAYLDAGAVAYYVLGALRWAGFERGALVEPGGWWPAFLERAGLNPDLWRLGGGIRVS